MVATPQTFPFQEPVQVFWAPYDPLDLASGSLDPLGFGRGYLALADRFLPGFTTVTSFPRYVSMLCAAIRTATIRCPSGQTCFLASAMRDVSALARCGSCSGR